MDNQEIEINLDDDILELEIDDNDTLEIGLENSDVIYENNYNQLENKPQINNITLEGNKTLEDLGIINDLNYVHTQNTASDTWVIVHNLNKYPSATIINSAGDEVIGDIFYDNLNQITITFKGAFKGKATLN